MGILKKLKRQVTLAMKTAYQGTTHKDPKVDRLVWRVAKKVYEEKLHLYTEDRAGNAKAKAVPDILIVGEAKLKSSSLSTFNRKIRAMIEGGKFDEESDLLPEIDLLVNIEDSDLDSDSDSDSDDDQIDPCEAVVE